MSSDLSQATAPVNPRATLRFVFAVVGGSLALVTLLLVGVGLLLPNKWQVEREVLINAPPTTILPLLDDFQNWQLWASNPKDDPTLAYSYEGPTSGVGARRLYTGKYAGHGYTEIVRSDPTFGVSYTSAVRSDQANAHSSITLKPQGGVTSVVWTDQGEISSVFGVFLRANVEEQLIEYMEGSLARLKAEAERRAAVQ